MSLSPSFSRNHTSRKRDKTFQFPLCDIFLESNYVYNSFHYFKNTCQFLEFCRMHRLQTPRKEIAFTEWTKIHSHTQIFSYSRSIFCPNVSTTPIPAMGCQQCLHLSVVQLKGKHCRKPHCPNGVVGTFRLCLPQPTLALAMRYYPI